MVRAETAARWDRADGGAGVAPANEFVLPSRGDALKALESALVFGEGPVLLTGESGSGKSWLCRRLRDSMPAPWRFATVDLGPSVAAAGLYGLVAHALGMGPAAGPSASRTRIADALNDAALDGARWVLVVEESHNAPTCVLEELRVLGNHLGEPGAFAGLILSGQNALARRLMTRDLAPFNDRIAARVHLRPLDVDEFHAWLSRLQPGHPWDADTVEWRHRECGGNPRRLLGRATPRPAAAFVPETKAPAVLSAPAAPAANPAVLADRPTLPSWESGASVQTRPPLHVGDGMIEVGWDASPEPGGPAPGESDPGFQAGTPVRLGRKVRHDSPTAGTSEEVIDDHYAALQAWSEWAESQGREPVPGSAVETRTVPIDDGLDADESGDTDPDDPPTAASEPVPGRPDVWADGRQQFAPYSQLFSRLRQANGG